MIKNLDEIAEFLGRLQKYQKHYSVPLIPRPDVKRWLDELGMVDKDVQKVIGSGIMANDFLDCKETCDACVRKCDCLCDDEYEKIATCPQRSACMKFCGCVARTTSDRAFTGGCMWEFGIMLNGKPIYMKFREFDDGRRGAFTCWSFHKPIKPMYLVHKGATIHV